MWEGCFPLDWSGRALLTLVPKPPPHASTQPQGCPSCNAFRRHRAVFKDLRLLNIVVFKAQDFHIVSAASTKLLGGFGRHNVGLKKKILIRSLHVNHVLLRKTQVVTESADIVNRFLRLNSRKNISAKNTPNDSVYRMLGISYIWEYSPCSSICRS